MKLQKVILLEDVPKLGKKWDVVQVKHGFARNYLFSKSLALDAHQQNLIRIEELKKQYNKNQEKVLREAEEKARTMEGKSVTVSVEAKDDDTLYGSITIAAVKKYLESEEIVVDKNDILIEEPIKKLGVYEIQIRLHSEVFSTVKLWVVRK